jgi:hypothetical protein
MGSFISSKSAMRCLYSRDHGKLETMTPEQRPEVAMDFTRRDAGVTGKFTMDSRKSYKGLFGKHVPPLIVTYAIEHTSGAAYVGATADFFLRWRNHAKLLRAGGRKNIELQRLFDVDGIEAFTIRILRQFNDVDGLIDAEVQDSLPFKNLLNLRIGSWIVEDFARRAQGPSGYVPKMKRGPQTKARWYDGTGTGGRA